MHKETTGSGDFSNATLIKSADFSEKIGMEGHYVAKCYDKDGNLKWEDVIENQVVEVGKQLMLNTLLSGSSYTTTGPYMGLVGSTGTTVNIGSFTVGATYQISVVGTGGNWTSIGASSATVGVVFVATGVGSGTGGQATLIGTYSPTDTISTHAGWTELTTNFAARGTVAFANTASLGGQTVPGTNVTTKASSSATSFSFTGNLIIGGCFIITGSGASATLGNTGGTLYSAGAFTGGPKSVGNTDQLNVSYSTTATS
jgi:hypothetical protein